MPVRRTQRLCRDGFGDIVVGLGLCGDFIAKTGDEDMVAVRKPGELGVLDYAQPYVGELEAPYSHRLHIYLPRAAVTAAIGADPAYLHGKPLSQGGLAQMLAAQMKTFAAIAPTLKATAQAIALQATVDLALTVLRLDFGDDEIEEESCEDGVFTAAQCFINRHYDDTELTPDAVARNLRCSRAHLYRVFARHGAAVAEYIREVRLQRARAVLEADFASRETIGDIAFRCGFDNPIYFARLFKDRFGMLPREARISAVERHAKAA
jgi:AraC-like DNA-binding protein